MLSLKTRINRLSPNVKLMHALANERPDLLDLQTISQALSASTRRSISDIRIFQEIDSTNSYLMRQAKSGQDSMCVCLAEMQTAGKGRCGKDWISPFGANLYLSLSWRCRQPLAGIARLSFLTALATVDALTALHVENSALKWPNDVFWQGKKLAGILLETVGGSSGGTCVVIGVGVNVRMPESARQKIDQPWTDLTAALADNVPSRNLLAARILNELVSAIRSFEHDSGRNLQQAWRRYDLLYNRTIELQTPDGHQRGKAQGIDAEGRLLLEIDGKLRAFSCGEVNQI